MNLPSPYSASLTTHSADASLHSTSANSFSAVVLSLLPALFAGVIASAITLWSVGSSNSAAAAPNWQSSQDPAPDSVTTERDEELEEANDALVPLNRRCDQSLEKLKDDLLALRDNTDYQRLRDANDRSGVNRMRRAFITPFLDEWIPKYDALGERFHGTPGEIAVAAARLERQVTRNPANLIESVALRHADSHNLAPIVRRFPWAYRYLGRDRYFEMISNVLSVNSSNEVQAHALYARAIPALFANPTNEEERVRARDDMLRVKELVPKDSLLWKRANGPEFEESRLQIGMKVPEITGMSLDGQPLQLSDFHGKVMVLLFWGDWCAPSRQMYEYTRGLVNRMRGRPFTVVGVNSDSSLERARRIVKTNEINWTSFWNGEEGAGGPISSLWNVHRWPTIYVVDHQGMIRDTNKGGEELDEVVDGLVAVAEKD